MADFTIKDPPEYDPELRMLEPTDPNHADVFNALFGQLINNEAFLAEMARRTAQALAEHLGSDVVHVTAQQKEGWDAKAGTVVATQEAPGLMAAADKKKLDGVSAGAEVNQNAYGSINVGNMTVTANGKTATFTLEAGSNVTMSEDNATKKITVAANRDGGNADMLDGYHAAHFAVAGHGHAEVDELKKSVSDGKTSVAAAVTAKGVTTAADATFATIAANIGKISTGVDTSDATATAVNVLSGKTCYVKGAKVTGKMTNRGAVTQALNAGGSYTIPAGYHNGSGKVTANSLAGQTAGTVEEVTHPQTGAAGYSNDIFYNKTAWSNGKKLTGLIQKGSSLIAHIDSSGTLKAANSIPYPVRILSNESVSISGLPLAIGLTADKIVKGNTILGVAGTGGGQWNQKNDGFTFYYQNPKTYIKLEDFLSGPTQVPNWTMLIIETEVIGDSITFFDILLLRIVQQYSTSLNCYLFGNRYKPPNGNLIKILNGDYGMSMSNGLLAAYSSVQALGNGNISISNPTAGTVPNQVCISVYDFNKYTTKCRCLWV